MSESDPLIIVCSVKKIGRRQHQLTVGDYTYGDFMHRNVALERLKFLDDVLTDLRSDGHINVKLDITIEPEDPGGTTVKS